MEEGKTDYRLEWHTCRICGKSDRNKTYVVKEMMYGTKKEFDYFVCNHCKCMQIAEVPDNLGEYYQDDYYSFKEVERKEIKGSGEHKGDAILDVGCGSGKYLCWLAEMGYENLYGCDPFIEKDIQYGDKIYIRKCEIGQMEGKFDYIRFGDSFEHLTNPLKTLAAVKKLLKKDGVCRINMPIFPNLAFDAFGVNWYQLDAPRHIFLHSRESVEYLCKECGFQIDEFRYDSNMFQFIISYLYEEGIPLRVFTNNAAAILGQMEEQNSIDFFQKEAANANEMGYGDYANILISHLE